MTAQNPQGPFEWAAKGLRDWDAQFHTPPQFPIAQTQEEYDQQAHEMYRWEQQERYGKPLPAWPYGIATSTFWLLVAVLGISACFAGEPLGVVLMKILFFEIPVLTVIFLLKRTLRIASDPERYYASRGVRTWAGFLRGCGQFYIGWKAWDLVHPGHQWGGTSSLPRYTDQFGHLQYGTPTPSAYPTPMVPIDSNGLNIQPGHQGPIYFRPQGPYGY